MTLALAALLVVHGLIHLLGFLKAFGLAALPQLALPISRPLGLWWLLAALALLATAWALWGLPRWWWAVGTVALLLSQGVVLTAWSDARFGTVANALVLVAVAYGWLSLGPTSLRAEYERDVARGLARAAAAPLVTEQDLAPLPAAVQRYLRLTGAVGQPRVQGFRVRFTGQFRQGPSAPWMDLAAEQHSFAEGPTRLFFMRASRAGLPADGYHRFIGEDASMRVRVVSLFPVVDARGPSFAATEAVTLLNDMCVLAPAMLIDGAIAWEELDARTVRATFRHGGRAVRAELSFNEAGELSNFWSDDRPALEPDGRTFAPQRWSTPLSEYRSFGPQRVASYAEARYAPRAGEYAYGRFRIVDLEYNPSLAARP